MLFLMYMAHVIRGYADEQQQQKHKGQRTSWINTSNYFGILMFFNTKRYLHNIQEKAKIWRQ